jgi:hypothetical protein
LDFFALVGEGEVGSVEAVVVVGVELGADDVGGLGLLDGTVDAVGRVVVLIMGRLLRTVLVGEGGVTGADGGLVVGVRLGRVTARVAQ